MKEVSTSALRCEPFSIYHTIYNEIDSREQIPLRARVSMNSFIPSRKVRNGTLIGMKGRTQGARVFLWAKSVYVTVVTTAISKRA